MNPLTAVRPLCERLAAVLLERQWRLASAESCSGGLIAAACTELSGSSQWFERGWVTYANEAKTGELGVSSDLIAAHGAVSEAVARAMARGALAMAPVQCSVAVTGVAGPTGGSPDKPVGLVWFAWGTPQGVFSESHHFPGDRAAVRAATVRQALEGLLQRL